MATTLRQALLTYHPEKGAPVTVRLNSKPNDPKRFVAIYRTEADAEADGKKPDCKIALGKNSDGYIWRAGTPPDEASGSSAPNDPGCIQFADGSWWCPGKDTGVG